MALAKGKVNPLNVVGQRRLPYIPEHFSRITVDLSYDKLDKTDHWIYTNLDSRYSIVVVHTLNENRQIVERTSIGLEDPKELSMLSLACPYLQKG